MEVALLAVACSLQRSPCVEGLVFVGGLQVRARANIRDASGTVAYRKYEYHFPDGTSAAFAVTLCFSDDSDAAKVARDRGAVAHGQVSVVGVPHAPLHPMLWLWTKDELVTLVAEDDPAVSDDLHRMLVQVMRTFFKDVRDVAPDLAALRL
jgi:hypothetical protein